MLNTICMDKYGNSIYHLTQWDVNQQLIIDVEGFELPNAPIIHFCNKNSDRSMGVQSVQNDNIITVDIPNDLLRQPYNIFAYLYLEDGESGKTIQLIEIPVKKKPQPLEYEYTDNIDVIYLKDVLAEVNKLFETGKSIDEKIDKETLIRQEEMSTLNEKLNKSISDLTTKLNNEVESRQNVDANLLKYIDDEIKNRTEKDEEIEKSIKELNKVTNEEITSITNRIIVLEKDSHTHDNKELLDSISQEDIDNWNSIEEQVTQEQFDSFKQYIEEICYGFSNEFQNVYTAIGITVYDGGLFGAVIDGIALDGGEFEDEVVGMVDCGDFEPITVVV